MVTSRLASRGRTTIPWSVRVALGMREGDEIAYSIEAGRVVLTVREHRDMPFHCFTEWDSEADRLAYANL